eukprot:3669664-Prymnesium_polylepis.1
MPERWERKTHAPGAPRGHSGACHTRRQMRVSLPYNKAYLFYLYHQLALAATWYPHVAILRVRLRGSVPRGLS